MQEPVRINKYLSEAGVCSRREADRQVEAGNVTIDGVVASMGAKVLPDQTGSFLRKARVKKEEEMILLAFHKPTELYVPLKRGKRIMSWITSIIRNGFIRLEGWTKIPKAYCL